MVTLPLLVTVAAGMYAPGHLGELTRYLPFELVDDVLGITGAAQKRLRALPSRVGMYFVLALALTKKIHTSCSAAADLCGDALG